MADKILSSAGVGVYTPEGYAAALLKLGPEFDQAIRAGMRKGFASARGIAVAYFRREGIGRRVFGKKASGAFSQIKTGTPARFGDVYVNTLRATGLAALQEGGYRTRPHVIRPKNAKFLRFEAGRGPEIGPLRPGQVRDSDMGPGGAVFSREVKHPGGQHPKRPFLQRAIERAQPRIREEIDKSLQAALAKAKVA